jgi:GT2 family glycosyltransferase
MAETGELVYIIILNWNGWQDTVECVDSCRKLTYPNFRILLVDNGSTDGSEGLLRERFPDLEFIQTGANLGFAGGNNVGMKYALDKGADYVWLLNNDTVVDGDALAELVRVAASGEKTGIVGSKIYYLAEPRKIWFAGGIWRTNKSYASHRGLNDVDAGQYNEVCEVDYITGCSLLIKSRVIRDIGMMNEEYFLYWEEIDWNAAAARRGWKIVYVPRSMVWHRVSSSLQQQGYLQNRYTIRNCLRFFRRYEPARLLPLFCYIGFDAVKFYTRGQKDVARGYLHGMMDFFAGRSGRIPGAGEHPHREPR